MFLKKTVQQIEKVQQLRGLDVTRYIPADTKFVTIITAIPLTNTSSIKERVLPATDNALIGFLSHNGVNLTLSSDTGVIFSVPLTQIVHIDTVGIQDYFRVVLQDGGWYFGQPVAVKKGEGATFKTFDSGITDYTGGWSREFTELGVITPRQATRTNNLVKLFIIVWLALFLGFFLFIFLHH